jgi:hypothetical protein
VLGSNARAAQLALVAFGGDLLLYTRSNPASHGSRHVQVTRSSDGGESWSAFEQVTIEGYDMGSGDIYYFGAQVNPSHNGSLLATFPLVHRLRGCIGLAASLDGVHWSRVTPLLSCSIFGERTMDQPALPAMVRRGGEVWLYVHEEVPGITSDRAVPLLLQPFLLKAERPSRVVRYAFPCQLLASWTEDALTSLVATARRRAGGVLRSGWQSLSVPSNCGPDAAVAAAEQPQVLGGDCEWKARGAGQASTHKRSLPVE